MSNSPHRFVQRDSWVCPKMLAKVYIDLYWLYWIPHQTCMSCGGIPCFWTNSGIKCTKNTDTFGSHRSGRIHGFLEVSAPNSIGSKPHFLTHRMWLCHFGGFFGGKKSAVCSDSKIFGPLGRHVQAIRLTQSLRGGNNQAMFIGILMYPLCLDSH